MMKTPALLLFLLARALSAKEEPQDGLFLGGLICGRDPENVCKSGFLGLFKHYSVRRFNGDECEDKCTMFPGANRLSGFRCGSCPKCFADKQELKTAVDAYLAAADPEQSDVAAMYGYPMNSWCVKDVTDFSRLFTDADFSEDLNDWNVKNAVDMQFMFTASTFNGDISNWDVSKVKEMQGMFEDATNFQGDLSNWNTASLENTEFMFARATSFSSDLSKWKTSKVQEMCSMFEGAVNFNSDVSNWDVGQVTDFNNMFAEAETFTRNLCPWRDDMVNITNIFKVTGMFLGTDCPLEDDPEVTASKIESLCYSCNTPGGS